MGGEKTEGIPGVRVKERLPATHFTLGKAGAQKASLGPAACRPAPGVGPLSCACPSRSDLALCLFPHILPRSLPSRRVFLLPQREHDGLPLPMPAVPRLPALPGLLLEGARRWLPQQPAPDEGVHVVGKAGPRGRAGNRGRAMGRHLPRWRSRTLLGHLAAPEPRVTSPALHHRKLSEVRVFPSLLGFFCRSHLKITVSFLLLRF